MIPNHPLRFTPILKRLIWGGDKLGSVLKKPIGPEGDYAESWELSDYGVDQSTVADGPFSGRTLHELIAEFPIPILGPALSDRMQFPLLIKFLDAAQALSVQVHPNDEMGKMLVNDNGKTECWVILQSDPESVLYAGLRADVGRQEFATAMEKGTVEALLHRFHPQPGDCVFIPAGTVHAIGAGILLAEIQQMSNATFRIHDWGRTDASGLSRSLHRAEALQSINFHAHPVEPQSARREPVAGGTGEELVHCPYFHLRRLTLTAPSTIGSTERFTVIINVGGSADVQSQSATCRLEYGQTFLLPAAAGAYQVIPHESVTMLCCTVPDAA